MMSSTSSEDYEYTFENKLDDDINYYKPDFHRALRAHSRNIQYPVYSFYESYPSYITITLQDKKETWFQYIKRQVTRFFRCFSIKIYSNQDIPDLQIDTDI